jgi:hypothetical protein
MAYTPVTVADFKSWFVRDFFYDTTPKGVMDSDITNALATAGINFNSGLMESQAVFSQMFLLLSAHFLVTNIRASSAGLSGQFAGLTNNKSVGNVSEGYTIPPQVQNNAFLMGLYSTQYGAQYVTLLAPRLIGHVMTVIGNTTP